MRVSKVWLFCANSHKAYTVLRWIYCLGKEDEIESLERFFFSVMFFLGVLSICEMSEKE